MNTQPSPPASHSALSLNGRLLILAVGFLGWLFAGVHMSITQLAGQSAPIDLLDRTGELQRKPFETLNRQLAKGAAKGVAANISAADVDQWRHWRTSVDRWFAWYQCAFLFGAATGGLVFGQLGDKLGRAKGMALSILTYSGMAGAAYFAQTPAQLLVVWFLACSGVGGMWPNGVALVSEAWSGMSRPMVAGLIGTSANIGIFLMSTAAAEFPITSEDWRWVMLVGAAPLMLGLLALCVVPESPRWLAARQARETSPAATGASSAAPSTGDVFRPPWLGVTLVGIALATIPLVGGWGSANWMIPWADEAGQAARPQQLTLKAHVMQARSITGIVGSLLGGWIASYAGRRLTYFLVSLIALGVAEYIFWFVYPTDASFLYWVSVLGFFSGIYFGWMPLFLPELFPTQIRSTGAGVSFNFGRILTAITMFATGALIEYFRNDYANIGRVTSLVFGLGLVVIWFVPDTTRNQLEK